MGRVEADRIIASIATGQHAAVSRRQLLDAGVPAHVIDHRVRSGRPARRCTPACTGWPAARVTWHQRIMAATLAAGAGAVASHRAAAYLHGPRGSEPRRRSPCRGPGHRRSRRRRRAPGRPSPASDVEIRDGIPRTRPPATILGPGRRRVDRRSWRWRSTTPCCRALVSCDQLQRRLEPPVGKGGRGAGTLAELLALRAGATSALDAERVRAPAASPSLPPPACRCPSPSSRSSCPTAGGYSSTSPGPTTLLALEAESYRHHAGRIAWCRDQAAIGAAGVDGLADLPVTWDDLVGARRADRNACSGRVLPDTTGLGSPGVNPARTSCDDGRTMSEATVVVVEDDQNIADLVELYLRQEGFRVVQAGDRGAGHPGGAGQPAPHGDPRRRPAGRHGRAGGVPAAAGRRRRPDPHADGPGRGDRPGARPRAGRRRLRHQAVRPPGAGGPGEGHPAAHRRPPRRHRRAARRRHRGRREAAGGPAQRRGGPPRRPGVRPPALPGRERRPGPHPPAAPRRGVGPRLVRRRAHGRRPRRASCARSSAPACPSPRCGASATGSADV